LGQVDLEAGQVIIVKSRGCWSSCACWTRSKRGLPTSTRRTSMLDPWVEFPLPASSITIVGQFGPLPPPRRSGDPPWTRAST